MGGPFFDEKVVFLHNNLAMRVLVTEDFSKKKRRKEIRESKSDALLSRRKNHQPGRFIIINFFESITNKFWVCSL